MAVQRSNHPGKKDVLRQWNKIKESQPDNHRHALVPFLESLIEAKLADKDVWEEVVASHYRREGSKPAKPTDTNPKNMLRGGRDLLEAYYAQAGDEDEVLIGFLPGRIRLRSHYEPRFAWLRIEPRKPIIAPTTGEIVHATFFSQHDVLYGRSREMKEVLRLLSDRTSNKGVVIQAIGGMGKTALAFEACYEPELLNSFEVITGAKAPRREVRLDPRAPASRMLESVGFGSILRPRELLVTLAMQLGMANPDGLVEVDLLQEILLFLKNKRTLIILDNLESIHNTVEVIDLLRKLCKPPIRKALVTARQFPNQGSIEFAAFSLGPINDEPACRRLVIDRLRKSVPKGDPHESVSAILDIAQGHPLAMTFLVGKLIAGGPAAILSLRDKWRSGVPTLDDPFLGVLCRYVFDDAFLDYVGLIGVDLLNMIAIEPAGIIEDDAFAVSDLSASDFEKTLAKLFEAGAIQREISDNIRILTMHPITQNHFRTLAPWRA